MGYKDIINKNERARIAAAKTAEYAKNNKEEIDEVIKNTLICTRENIPSKEQGRVNKDMKIFVETSGVINSIMKFADEDNKFKTAVLNFASFKEPGGGYLKGSISQEEILCSYSFLYNVIGDGKFTPFYNYNKSHTNKSLYLDRGLYSPNIAFISEKSPIEYREVDVITVASPNHLSNSKYFGENSRENTEALESRIKFVLDIAEYSKVDTPILGAFGCGVFKQSPQLVSELFYKYLPFYSFQTVVFALANKSAYNTSVFTSKFCNMEKGIRLPAKMLKWR